MGTFPQARRFLPERVLQSGARPQQPRRSRGCPRDANAPSSTAPASQASTRTTDPMLAKHCQLRRPPDDPHPRSRLESRRFDVLLQPRAPRVTHLEPFYLRRRSRSRDFSRGSRSHCLFQHLSQDFKLPTIQQKNHLQTLSNRNRDSTAHAVRRREASVVANDKDTIRLPIMLVSLVVILHVTATSSDNQRATSPNNPLQIRL